MLIYVLLFSLTPNVLFVNCFAETCTGSHLGALFVELVISRLVCLVAGASDWCEAQVQPVFGVREPRVDYLFKGMNILCTWNLHLSRKERMRMRKAPATTSRSIPPHPECYAPLCKVFNARPAPSSRAVGSSDETHQPGDH